MNFGQTRKPTKCVKRVKGKNGKPDSIDLIVQIERVDTWTVISYNASLVTLLLAGGAAAD